jgi:ATP-dependent RNA helicase DeaD
VLEQLEAETGVPLIDIAAALARLAQGTTPLLLAGKPESRPAEAPPAPDAGARPERAPRPERKAPLSREEFYEKETYRIAVGEVHGVKPGNIVGAIANEADIEGVHIGRVDIREDHSFVDLPGGMPQAIFDKLQTVRIAGRELRLTLVREKPPKPPKPRKVLKRS